jgi:hypothetical protein
MVKGCANLNVVTARCQVDGEPCDYRQGKTVGWQGDIAIVLAPFDECQKYRSLPEGQDVNAQSA